MIEDSNDQPFSSGIRSMRFSLIVLSCVLLTACAHEAENTGVENSSVMTIPGTYAMSTRAEAVREDSPVAAGRVSRFQRHVIVPGGPDGEMSASAKSFDAIMDNLEGLMMPQIEENNRIAAQQAAIPGYTF